MDEPLLIDRTQEPEDAELEQLLGRAKSHWDKLIHRALEAEPSAEVTWKFYGKKSGWVLVVRGKKRNVLYMRPIAKRRFAVTFAFNDKHVEATQHSSLPAELVTEIRNAKKYPEGRMARVAITTSAEHAIAKTLLAIKQSV